MEKLTDIHKIDIFSEEDCLTAVKSLACNPSEVIVNQVNGSVPIEAWDILPLSLAEVATATREDKTFGCLLQAVEAGVLDRNDPELKKFSGVFDDLWVQDNVVYFGSRVVIPTCQQQRLLEELHYTHIGSVRMKYTARNYFWWPGLSKAIDTVAVSCPGCRKFRKKPPLNH